MPKTTITSPKHRLASIQQLATLQPDTGIGIKPKSLDQAKKFARQIPSAKLAELELSEKGTVLFIWEDKRNKLVIEMGGTQEFCYDFQITTPQGNKNRMKGIAVWDSLVGLVELAGMSYLLSSHRCN